MSHEDAIEALVQRFPAHAQSIRSLHAEDTTFRAVCEDHAEAARALAYWQAADQSSQRKAEEYRRLLQELEDEAVAALQAYESSGRRA